MYNKTLSCCITSALLISSAPLFAKQKAESIMSSQETLVAPLINAPISTAIKGSYIVVLKQSNSITADKESLELYTQNTAQFLADQNAFKINRVFDSALSAFTATLDTKQLESLRRNPNVNYIEQDQTITIDPVISNNASQTNAIWGLDRIDQRDLPLSGSYDYNYDGTGVTAYVIDTGVTNTHSEFGGRSTSGYDFVDNDNDATDCNGHGTHVAGTIGGAQYGVAKNVNIVGVRVLSCRGSGTTSGVIGGVDWVAENASGPSVANMSLGGGVSSALDQAVANAVQSGISFLLAAGNSNADACNSSPAREPTGVTVGSTTNRDSRSSFSNWGSCVDVFAPGSNIKSAWYDGGYKTISGTSMATPHVAGVAALYLQEKGSLSPSELSNLISQRASVGKVRDTKGTTNKLLYSQSGSGCGNDCPPPPPPTNELENGVPKTNLQASRGQQQEYFIDVSAGKRLQITLSGGSGDADLYVRYGAKPNTSQWDCRPYRSGNNEVCTISSTQAGRYHVMLNAYSAYNGAKLLASY